MPLVPAREIQPAWTGAKPSSAPAAAATVHPAAAKPAPPSSRLQAAIKQARAWWLLVACGAAGIVLSVVWYEGIEGVHRRLGAAESQLRAVQAQAAQFQKQAEDAEMKLLNVQTGVSQMNKVFSELKTPPPQPQYLRLPAGVLVFWIDGMLWRRYHFYQVKGTQKPLQRATKRSTQRNFVYLPDLEPGIWRFGVTALDREGNETDMSEILEVKVQP